MELRSYDPAADQIALADFAARMYGPASFLCNEGYVKWWFASSPERRSQEPSDVLLACDSGRIVAMNAHIASSVCQDAESRPLVWLANTMVDPAYRSRGLGVRMIEESLRRYENVGSISFRPDAARVLGHLGFELFGLRGMSRAVALLDRAPLEQFLNDESLRALCVVVGGPSIDLSPVPIEALGDVEAVWQRVRARYGVSTARSAQLLEWRYFHHPSGSYKLFAHPSTEPRAVAVVRIDGRTLRALRIVDLFGEELAVGELLEHVVAFARERACAFVDFHCTGRFDRGALEQAGFSWLPPERAGSLPTLLNPVELRDYHEQLALRLSPASRLPDYDRTYFTRGDADRDRPPSALS